MDGFGNTALSSIGREATKDEKRLNLKCVNLMEEIGDLPGSGSVRYSIKETCDQCVIFYEWVYDDNEAL